MGNVTAITETTLALRRLIEMAAREVAPGAIATTVAIDARSPLQTGVNVLLLRATPQATMRSDLERRPAGGPGPAPSPLALNLHYLITFHGDDASLQRQELLEVVAARLHESPILGSPTVPTPSGDARAIAPSIRPAARITLLAPSTEEWAQIRQMLAVAPPSPALLYEVGPVAIAVG